MFADTNSLLSTLVDGNSGDDSANALLPVLLLPGLHSHVNILIEEDSIFVGDHDALKKGGEVELAKVGTLEEALENFGSSRVLLGVERSSGQLLFVGVHLHEDSSDGLTSLLVVTVVISSDTGIEVLEGFLEVFSHVVQDLAGGPLEVRSIRESSLADWHALFELLVSSEGTNSTTYEIVQGGFLVSFEIAVSVHERLNSNIQSEGSLVLGVDALEEVE